MNDILSRHVATTPMLQSSHQASKALTSIREFLAFRLGAEEYGLDILMAQEIRSFEVPTRMANTPSHILGISNLRGVIVPIVDMRIKFNLEQVQYNELTVIIVLNIGGKILGMVVDGVSDVISFESGQLRPVPEFSSVIDHDYLLAVGTVENRMMMLLDIERLMRCADMGLAQETREIRNASE